MEQINDAIEKLRIPEVRKKYEDEERRERQNDADQKRKLQKHYRNIQKQHDRA